MKIVGVYRDVGKVKTICPVKDQAPRSIAALKAQRTPRPFNATAPLVESPIGKVVEENRSETSEQEKKAEIAIGNIPIGQTHWRPGVGRLRFDTIRCMVPRNARMALKPVDPFFDKRGGGRRSYARATTRCQRHSHA